MSLLPHSVIRDKSLSLAHKQGNGDEAPSFEGRGIEKFMDLFYFFFSGLILKLQFL